MAFSAIEALQAFGLGAQMKQQRTLLERQEAQIARQEQTRGAVAQQVSAGNYQGGVQAAIAGGEYDLAGSLTRLDEGQRERALQEAQVMGRTARSLRGLPLEQRLPTLQRLAPQLRQVGFSEEELAAAAQDLSDGALEGAIAHGEAVSQVLRPASTAQPYRWRTNAGDLMEIGPDGQPRQLYDDPTQRTQWQRVEDPRTGAITLVPVPTGAQGAAPATPTPELPPGFVLDEDEGGPSPDGSATFP